MIKRHNILLIAIVFSWVTSVASLAMEDVPDSSSQATNAVAQDDIKWTISHVGQGGILIAVDAGAFKPSSALDEALTRLRSEPLKLLQHCQILAADFDQRPEFYEQLVIENPVFLLGECTHTQCGLNRQSDCKVCPRHRAKKLVGQYVLPELKDNGDRVVASYASGGLFFDLDLLQSLSDRDVKIRKFIAIDPEFTFIVRLVRTLGLFGDFTPSQLLKLTETPDLTAIPQLSHQRMTTETVRRVQQFLQALVFLNGYEQGRMVELYLLIDAADCASNDNGMPNIDFAFGMDYRICGREPWAYFFDININIWDRMATNAIFADFSMNHLGKFHATVSRKQASREQPEAKIFESQRN